MGLLIAYWGRQRSILVNTSQWNWPHHPLHRETKSHGKAGSPSDWGVNLGGGSCFLCRGEHFRGMFYGHCWKHRGYSKTQRHSALSWISHPLCLADINYWPDSGISPLGHHPTKGRAFIFQMIYWSDKIIITSSLLPITTQDGRAL